MFGMAALAAAAMSLAAAGQDPPRSTAGREQYRVVSASSSKTAGAEHVETTAFPVNVRRIGSTALPDSLTLVMVGSMLLGLAAAVRRTT